MTTAQHARDQAYREAHKAAFAEAFQAAQLKERERIMAILGHPEAKGREKMAVAMATKTDLPVEAAAAIMASVTREGSGQSNWLTFHGAMQGISNPQVTAGEPVDLSESQAAAAVWDRAMGAARGSR